MLSIKLTPFILFLIILIVLVISIILGNRASFGSASFGSASFGSTSFGSTIVDKEGFIAYGGDKRPLNKVWVDQYSTSKTVYKLQDNIFFDSTNGNLIELDAAALTETNYDNTGSTIKNVLITPRNTKNTVVVAATPGTPVDTEPSKIDTIAESFDYWVYPSKCTTASETNTLYISWNKTTYISIFAQDDNSAWSLSNNFYFDGGSVSNGISPSTTFITGIANDTHANNNKTIKEPLYDSERDVYQLNKNVKFDTKNGNLIILANGVATIYDRNKSVIQKESITNSITKVGFVPWWAIDTEGQKFVLYLANGMNTVVGLVGFKDASKTEFVITNLKRFTKDGLFTAPNANANANSPTAADATCSKTSSVTTTGTTNIPSSQPDSVISEYFKWYWYWKSSASAPDNNNDYILKTQIVPPVCPSCPACSANGTCGTASACTNCGGQGGSGTLTQTGTSIFDASGNPTSCAKLGPTGVGYDASKNKISCANIVSGVAASAAAAPQIQTAGAAASSTIKSGVNGVGDVVNTTVNKVGDVATNVVGAAGNLAGTVVKTTGSVLKTAADDVTGLFKSSGNSNLQPTNADLTIRSAEQPKQSGTQRNTYYGTHNQIVDQYSYNGQLTSRGSGNYMPITADFSAFAK